MPAISKHLFYEKLKDDVSCSFLHFWEPNCLIASWSPSWIANMAQGAAKFFLPVYLIKLLLAYQKTKKKRELLLHILIGKARTTFYGVVMAFLIIFSICVLRAIFGRLHYYNVLFIPGIISGLSLLVESDDNRVMALTLFFNSCVETVLRKTNFSKPLQVATFTVLSAFLMDFFENRREKTNILYIWFYTPPRREIKQETNSECEHDISCSKFLYEGFRRYFAVGYGINILRTFLSKFKVLPKNPLATFQILFNWSNCRLGLFIGSYAGLYRAITCYLVQSKQVPQSLRCLLAGWISGLTFAIYPKTQFLVLGITACLQMVYDHISTRLKITDHFWQRQLLFMFCQGYLLHNAFFFPATCSSYYKNMVIACTNGRIREIYRNVMYNFFD